MNVKRFVGKNAREAIAQARGLWGDQTVVLSNRPIPGGVEILAMAGAEVPAPALPSALAANQALPAGTEPAPPMSTLSFQQFVRDRQRRDAELVPAVPAVAAPVSIAVLPAEPGRFAAQALREELAAPALAPVAVVSPVPVAVSAAPAADDSVMLELKAMRGMIASQLASLSWFDTVRRNPAQTQLLRLMIGNGFSPALARRIVHRLPESMEESRAERWLLEALARNLHCAAQDSVGQQGGMYAIVGPTGVGKTTTCAKIAAHFARLHGPSAIGLITVDTYRMGASDQLRAFGRLLNIPVHTARDAASLTDLLDLFGKKKLVLVDTVGVGQRDPRLAELFAALPAGRLQKLLVLNASAQAETLEETALAYGAAAGTRCVITKLDEAVKCGGVVDTVIRHQLVVDGIATGQRVPEDWHVARAQLLVQKALMKQPASVFTQGDAELALMLTSPTAPMAPEASRGASTARVPRA